ncbi:MAG: chorismate--pyruvate lyase [Phenylobacterium sp.]|jgi:chorismate--pyruvate lyase
MSSHEISQLSDKISLPLSLETHWCNESSALAYVEASTAKSAPKGAGLWQWLFEQGSLTQKLKQHCSAFSVKILSKQQRNLSAKELIRFGYNSVDAKPVIVQVREVLLYCDGKPWVYAQTLMPLEVMPPSVVKLTTLGEKPLGEVIFNEPGVTRSEIEVAEFSPQSEVAKLAAEVDKVSERSLWGRRSMFTLDGYSLLVAEVFLPCAGVYQ